MPAKKKPVGRPAKAKKLATKRKTETAKRKTEAARKKARNTKPDGYTGAAKTQVGRVNRKSSSDRDHNNSVANDTLFALNYLQRQNQDLMDGKGKAKQFKSDVNFDRKRNKTSTKKKTTTRKKK